MDRATLSRQALGKLMPLHVVTDAAGVIRGHGPTLAKLVPGGAILGRGLFDLFDVRRPSGVADLAGLAAHAGEKLRLSLRGPTRPMTFRGLALPLEGEGGWLINLSFGIGVIDAVGAHGLTDRDFAATDLAVELMYLVEARAVAMSALRGLAVRLQDDKRMAEERAMTDTLTGLGNRRALGQVLEVLAQLKTPFGLMHVDLDYFKAVNDTLGHAAGDHVLRVVADVLRRETRDQDTVARVGGDEFVLVFPAISEPSRLEAAARRIIEGLSQPIEFEGNPCRISASIGIAISTQYDLVDPERMQSDADEALYASKRAGRGRAHLFRPETDRRSA